MNARRSVLTVVVDWLTFRNMPVRRRFTFFTLGVSFWYWVIGAVGLAHAEDARIVVLTLVALAVAHALLVLFAVTATKSLTVPLRAIMAKVREITSGGLADGAHIDVVSADEIGELTTRFNALLDALREVNAFKNVIEHDESTEEVFGRLARVFAATGLENHQWLMLDAHGSGLRPIGAASTAGQWCARKIADDAALCRAFRTALPVASEGFPGVCKHFGGPGAEHYCLPLVIGGATAGVAQLVYGPPLEPDRSEFPARLTAARRYLLEALPVLQARMLADMLRESAVRDGLTRLYNRRHLEETQAALVALVKRRKTTLGVVMGDIDHFKRVNDTYGHRAGDSVLMAVSAALVGSLRASDTAIRYGGEEFLLLLPDTDRAGAALVAERVRAAVKALEISAGGTILRVTMSLGVAEFPTDDASLSEAIRLADEALYGAKNEGRDRVVSRRNPVAPPPKSADL